MVNANPDSWEISLAECAVLLAVFRRPGISARTLALRGNADPAAIFPALTVRGLVSETLADPSMSGVARGPLNESDLEVVCGSNRVASW